MHKLGFIKILGVFRILAAAGLLNLSGAVPETRGGEANGRLDFYWVDAEGGGATLVVTPSGESLLFDSGNPGGRDAGRIHRMATREAGVEAIDYLITSHFHIDHFGGAAELSQLMPIRHIVDKGIPDTLVEDRSFPLRIKSYREISSERITIHSGDRVPLKQRDGGAALSLHCIAADQILDTRPVDGVQAVVADTTGPEAKPVDITDNADSLNFILRLGDFAFYHGGDTTWNVEARLVTPVNPHGRVDVYQVNHHGMDTSNNPVLIQQLSPVVTVMNNGHRKGCGPETFKTLSLAPSVKAMYQVRKNLRQDIENNTSDEYIANLGEKSDENVMKLSVAPDGLSYTMSIPARNHHRTFETVAK